MIRTTVRAWFASLVTLLVSSAGLFAVSATSTSTSGARMGVAAGVLGALAAVAGLVVTQPWDRSTARRFLWGAAVPAACGGGTAALVWSAGGWQAGLLAGLPWLLGAGLVSLLGARLPDLRLLRLGTALRRLRTRGRWEPDLER